MVNQKLEYRGEGYELRTSGYGAIRSGRGVMITAYDQPGAGGKQLDMAEAVAQMKELLALAETLVKSAEASKATPADTNAQQAINDALDGLKQPGALITAPGPVGVVSGDGVQLGADGSIIATAKKGVHFSTLKHFTVAAGRLASLFAQKGMNLIAAAGPVAVQAQRGPLQLAAQEDVTVETVDGVVHVKSPKEIVLNVDGTYLRMTADGIEMGTRGRIWFRTAEFAKSGPAQMDLGGVAFAPQFVPFTTECEVWRKNENFTREVAGAPEGVQQGNTADTGAASAAPDAGAAADSGAVKSVAPAPMAPAPLSGHAIPPPIPAGGVPAVSAPASSSSSGGGFVSDVVSGVSNVASNIISGISNYFSSVEIDDPNAPPKPKGAVNPGEYPEPIKMAKAVPCDWRIDSFEEKVVYTDMETATYYEYDENQTLAHDTHDQLVLCSGTAEGRYSITYDSKTKTLTATAVVALVPCMLVQLDPITKQPKHSKNGDLIEVNYNESINGHNSGYSFSDYNLGLLDRDTKINGSSYKKQIEKTLNQNNYKLILAGCRKGVSCGCRISVKFCADIHVVNQKGAKEIAEKDSRVFIVKLFDGVYRGDSGAWWEKDYGINEKGKLVEATTHGRTHEAGHLFAFPDEYWQRGGAVHKQYVKSDKTLDFALGKTNAGASMINRTWQLSSKTNLMGDGASELVSTEITTPPYYLEHIRRWFSLRTNRNWRVGYEGAK